ncbi:MAG: hypothetical protein JSS82_18770 [Bacteroidetes bacterium]|nr:hypothetical protein [Bacteroidota bacterium]
MHEQNDSGIFNLEVDEVAKSHLLETARWGKFLAIVGFIIIGLMVLLGLFGGMAASSFGGGGLLGGLSGVSLLLFYLLIAALYFYPCFTLYRFASNMKPAINTMNRQQFNSALGNMKALFQYMGIMTIIMLSLYGILLIFVIIGLAR